MFSGLSAFPLTPMSESGLDEQAFARLVENLVMAKLSSIGALGSTGSYAYLSRAERQHVAQLAVDAAGAIPVMVSIGALRTRDVLLLAEDAQKAGAGALLLPAMSYQKLTDDDVFSLYETVTHNISVPFAFTTIQALLISTFLTRSLGESPICRMFAPSKSQALLPLLRKRK